MYRYLNGDERMKIGDIIEETDIDNLLELYDKIEGKIPQTINKFSKENSIFKAQIVESGRITIPTSERKALGLEEGDVVQVFLRKVDLD